MPSLGSGEATAVARITLSPLDVRAAPEACLAMRPVSNLICLPPASSTITSCFICLPLLSLSLTGLSLGARHPLCSGREKCSFADSAVAPPQKLHHLHIF